MLTEPDTTDPDTEKKRRREQKEKKLAHWELNSISPESDLL